MWTLKKQVSLSIISQRVEHGLRIIAILTASVTL